MRYKGSRVVKWIFCSIAALTSVKAEVRVNIKDVDSACGQPQYNCRGAFQNALKALAKGGGGTLSLPAGTFLIDFPEVANDVPSGRPLQPASVISVPSKVIIQGYVGAGGGAVTTIEWKVTSVPVFIFASASYSGMKNLHLRFTGSTPTHFPYGDISLLRALGYKQTSVHQNQMSGGNYEMSTFAMVFDSEHCVFENLVFDSATRDNQHVFGFGFNVKGKGVRVEGGEGGLAAPADDNRFSNINLADYVMGFLISGQQNLIVDNVTADRRGSTDSIAPGHVIYFTVTNLYSADGKVIVTMSKNVRVTNISEGPHTYSNVNSLGTLAIKYIDGGTFAHINSKHPVGLIQSINAVKDVVFTDLNWSTDAAICEESAHACGTPVINSVIIKPGDVPNENLRFMNVVLKSKRTSVTTNFSGNNIELDGLTIEAPPVFTKTANQPAPFSALGFRDSSNVTIRNFLYVPLLTAFDPAAKYNQPFVCWGSCTNIKADVAIKWPRSLSPPASGHRAISSGIQFDKPEANNSITSRTEID